MNRPWAVVSKDQVKDGYPTKRGEPLVVPVTKDVNEVMRWKCGCPLIAPREWEAGEIITVGGPDIPLLCPEHGAEFADWILIAHPAIAAATLWNKR